MKRTQGKSARLLQVEQLLCAQSEPITQAEVARLCGVNRSTINRMLADLGELGVPIYEDERGRIAINRDAYLTNIRLTLDESMAVFLAARLLARHSDKPNPHVVEALLKVGLALEQGIAPQIGRHIVRTSEALRDRQAVLQPNYVRTLETLAKAWSLSQKVRMVYLPLHGKRPFEHTFSPYFIEPSAIGYSTYAIGLAEPLGEIRTRKVERIQGISLTGEPFEVPADFDPVKLLSGAWGIWFDSEDKPTTVMLRFSRDVARRVRETRWHPSERVEEDPATGELIWRAEISEVQEIVPWVRQWGADVEVIEPEGLRETIVRDARRMARQYGIARDRQDTTVVRLLRCWGKTPTGSQNASDFHPALFHMLDVGNVARELLSERASPRWRNALANALNADSGTLNDWVPWFVALHDIGKISAAFQSANKNQTERLKRENFSFDGWLTSWKIAHPSISQVYAADIVHTLSEAIGGHHGHFLHPDQDIKETRRKLAAEPAEWQIFRQTVDSLLRQVLLKCDLTQLPEPTNVSNAIMALTGFTILCDWLGSDGRYFQLTPDMELREYVETSRQRAEQAVRDSGLLIPTSSNAPTDVQTLFADLGGLRLLQHAISDIPLDLLQSPTLSIIEAPTGEGKTEAALALAHRIAQATGTDELYYALPTMATSNQMFGRLETHLHKRLGLDASIKLVHGQAFLVEAELRAEMPAALIQPLENGDVLGTSEGKETVTWFNSKKRALIAPFGVGTIDQAELAALNVKHAALRMMGLVGKVVIVDEVHAYDTYMTTIIERLLCWLASMNTSVVLLSATLPKSRRKQLVEAYGTKLDLKEEQADAYPSLLVSSANGTYHASPLVWQPDRTIELRELHLGDDDACAKAEWLLNAVADGGCVCWITNTVRRAQRIFGELRNLVASGIGLDLLHSQFPLDERQRREDELNIKYGRNGKRPTRGIVVGTQVLEQSLDLDFDVMVSDLAPIDLLLQRAGRLHRHDRGRPAAHDTPRLYVNWERLPEGELKIGTDRSIYAKFIMHQTHRTLAGRTHIQLPADYRVLIEAVYSDQEPPAGDPLRDAWDDLKSKQAIAVGEANQRLLPQAHPRDSFAKQAATRVQFEEDENRADWIVAQTRLGEMTLNIIPIERDGDFALFHGTDDRLDVNREAPYDVQRKLLKRNMRISDRDAIDAIQEKGEEEATKLFKESALLRGYYPLWLTDRRAQFKTERGMLRIRVDAHLGLVIDKEGKANGKSK